MLGKKKAGTIFWEKQSQIWKPGVLVYAGFAIHDFWNSTFVISHHWIVITEVFFLRNISYYKLAMRCEVSFFASKIETPPDSGWGGSSPDLSLPCDGHKKSLGRKLHILRLQGSADLIKRQDQYDPLSCLRRSDVWTTGRTNSSVTPRVCWHFQPGCCLFIPSMNTLG